MESPTIYLDVLILLNLFVTYFLLLSVQKMLRLGSSPKRIWAASCLGGICSMTILLPEMPAWLLQGEKVGISLLLTGLAFGIRPWQRLVKTTLCFYGVNFVFAGVMFAIWYTLSPTGMVLRNGSVYFQISAVVLAVSTIFSYLLLQLVSCFRGKAVPKEQRVQLKIKFRGNEVLLPGLVDTGNRLCDILTGLPVVICELDALSPLFPKEILPHLKDLSLYQIEPNSWKRVFRLIPLHTVGGQSTTIVFQPDEFVVLGPYPESKKALIGISPHPLSEDRSFCALLGSQLTEQQASLSYTEQPKKRIPSPKR